ncbi:TPA: hypothetical protein ACGS9W_004332 [Escherichia coli]
MSGRCWLAEIMMCHRLSVAIEHSQHARTIEVYTLGQRLKCSNRHFRGGCNGLIAHLLLRVS